MATATKKTKKTESQPKPTLVFARQVAKRQSVLVKLLKPAPSTAARSRDKAKS